MSAPEVGPLSDSALGSPEDTPGYSDSEPPARVVANSAWMMLAQAFSIVVGGLVSIYVIRNLATDSWGHYSTAAALVAIFAFFCGPGLAPLVLREMTSDRARQDEILGIALRAIGWTFCLVVPALFATAVAVGYPHEVLVLVALLSPGILLATALATFVATFNARSQLAYVAVFHAVQVGIYGCLAVVTIAASRSVTGIAVASTVSSLCGAALAFVLLRAKLRLRPELSQPARRVWSFLRKGTPIAGIDFVGVVYARVDVVMLSVLASASSVARYTVPYAFVRLSWVLPSIVGGAFFPLLSRRLRSDPADAEHLFFLVVRVFLFLSVPISLVLALSSSTLLPFVYGDAYGDSAVVLQIMAWTSVFGFQNYILWYGALAVHKERAVLGIMIVGLVVNVAINVFAIPLYGPAGAATALVISDLIVVAGQALIVHRHLFHVPLVELLAKPVVTGVVVVPVAVLVATRSPVGGAVIGAAAYAAILLALGYVTLEEWRPVIAVVRASLRRLRRGGLRAS